MREASEDEIEIERDGKQALSFQIFTSTMMEQKENAFFLVSTSKKIC